MSSIGGSPEALSLGHASVSASEKHANTPAPSATSPPPPAPPAPPPSSIASGSAAQKSRSCTVCRRRKVRCDKLSPCSNCRRANIPCVFPSTDRPPRWARRLEHLNAVSAGDPRPQSSASKTGAPPQVMDRIRTLESLVRELSGQLEQANNAHPGGSGATSTIESPRSVAGASEADRLRDAPLNRDTVSGQKDVGRLFVRDANTSRSRYVSSGFWSRFNDELDGLKTDLGGDNDDISEDGESQANTASSYQPDRTPSERHAFLFRHNLGADVPFNEFHPLPSQVPYILNVFAENVNYFLQVVHIPTLNKQIKPLRGADLSTLPVCTQALLFSIYFAAVTSLEDDDVMINFGVSKAELSLKYRLGMEHALAQADFLNNPDLALVQAFTIFLGLVRRHDSPRYVWMMTGLAIRMAQALGLHRDGSHFPHLTPFEVEMRRRIWGALSTLDLRASEDQGTDVTIARSSYDTRLPLNINDTDIDVDTKEMPPERPGIADSTVAVLMYKISDLSRRMITPGTTLDEQDSFLKEMTEIFERGYLQHTTDPENMAAWVGANCVRLVVAKMTLLVYLPSLFASPDNSFTEETRNKLLVAAIEVAEYNHALNSEEAARQWRWVYQTYTHWYAIVYLALEIIRRPLSPIVERAWLALHSRWLIPTNHKLNSSSQVWVPLRKMLSKAKQHRDSELERLRTDANAVRELEEADQNVPVPGSASAFATKTTPGEGEALFVTYWRNLVTTSQGESDCLIQTCGATELSRQNLPVSTIPAPGPFQQPQIVNRASPYPDPNTWSSTSSGPAQITASLIPSQAAMTQSLPIEPFPPGSWAISDPEHQSMPWLWTNVEPGGYIQSDPDVNMDIDGDIDWLSWMESAKNLESNHDMLS